MFLMVERTDTQPETRALVNTDHVVAVLPVAGGVKSQLCLSNGDSWEVALPFGHLIRMLGAEEAGG